MRVKHKFIENPLDDLPIAWRSAALFVASLVAARVVIFATG